MVPLTAGLAGALAAVGLTTLVWSPSFIPLSNARRGSTTTRADIVPASLETGTAGSSDLDQNAPPAVLRVAAWSGAKVRYGSAVLWRGDGVLVTSASLVADVTAVEVTIPGRPPVEAQLVGSDGDDDLAVLRVDQRDLSSLPGAAGRPGADPETGEHCFVVGAPSSPDHPPVAVGAVIDELGRVVKFGSGWLIDAIEVAADAETPMTGGALVDPRGHLLGIVTDAATDSSHLYAVPSGRASQTVEELLTRGQVRHPWLGVAASDAPSGAPAPGAVVHTVADAGPAATAGLRPGDVIVAVAGRPVDGMQALMQAVHRFEPGRDVVVTVVRDGQSIDLTVHLGVRP